jgi:hypothetical protein
MKKKVYERDMGLRSLGKHSYKNVTPEEEYSHEVENFLYLG